MIKLIKEGFNSDEDIEVTDVKDEFLYAFLLDRMTVFKVEFCSLDRNCAPHFSTSAARFSRNKQDYTLGGQAQEELLYGKAKQFYEKWDHLHLHDLTDDEYDEIVSDIEDLKRAYPYYVAYEFDGKATRTSIPFYEIREKSMEVPRSRSVRESRKPMSKRISVEKSGREVSESFGNDGRREYWFDNLGYFTEGAIDAIKSVADDKTWMRFEVISSNYAGNYTLGVVAPDSESHDHVFTFFINYLLTQLRK